MHAPDYGRTLPLSMSPAGIETFSSYMNRLAAHLEIPLLTLLQRLDLISGDHRDIPSRYGLAMQEQSLERTATMLRISREQLAATLFSNFDGACCDVRELADPSRSFHAVARVQWLYIRGSNACPDCLSESGGVWDTRWKLPWIFACRKHRKLLADFCPGCRQRIDIGRRTGRPVPAFPRTVPTPLLCSNAVRGGTQTDSGKTVDNFGRFRPCGYSLTNIGTRVVDGTVLEVQEHIDDAMSSRSVMVAGQKTDAREYFRDLRTLTRLALSLGDLARLEDVPECIRETLNDELHSLDQIKETYEGERTANGNGPAGTGLSVHKGVPNGATVSAAAILLADRVLRTESIDETVEKFAIFGERLVDKKMKHWMCSRALAFSPRLNRLTKPYWSKYGHGKRREFPLTPDRIPQLFWDDEYGAKLQELVWFGKDQRVLRLTFSVRAVRIVSDLDDSAALHALGVPPDGPVSKAVLRKLRILRERKRVAEWVDAHICERLEILLTENPVDYGGRRRTLNGLRKIDRKLWREWCEAAGVLPGWTKGGKSVHAATWLWSELTGGDYFLSPNFQDHPTHYHSRRYAKFLADDLPLLKGYLTEYGKTLV